MKLRTRLSGIVLVGATALAGCYGVLDSRYDFDGVLGDERVEFRRDSGEGSWALWGADDINTLIVTRDDGTRLEYIDRINDLVVDEVVVGGSTYSGREELRLAQQQFDDYLARILEHKQKRAVDAVSR